MSETKQEYAVTVYTEYKQEDLDLIKRTIATDATDSELKMFVKYAQRTGLDPFARQIYFSKNEKGRVNILTSIDGFRLVAERTEKYAGQLGPFWCGPDGKWMEVWLSSEPPAAAKVGILRSDFKEPIWSVARFASYNQPNKQTWQKMPDVMLAKCAESLGLRKAFPNELSGIYTKEEMDQADDVTVQVIEPKLTPEVKIKKSSRPFDLETLKIELLKASEKFEGQVANGKRSEVAASLSEFFMGDDGRHEFTEWLDGHASIKDMPDSVVLAMHRWLKPSYDKDAGRYNIDAVAQQELDIWVSEFSESVDEAN